MESENQEPVSSSTTITNKQVESALRQVIDPEIQYNIVDLGLIYGTAVDGQSVNVEMTLTTPACPYGPMLIHQVKEAVTALGASDVNIELVWNPPWSLEKMTDEAKLELGVDL